MFISKKRLNALEYRILVLESDNKSHLHKIRNLEETIEKSLIVGHTKVGYKIHLDAKGLIEQVDRILEFLGVEEITAPEKTTLVKKKKQ